MAVSFLALPLAALAAGEPCSPTAVNPSLCNPVSGSLGNDLPVAIGKIIAAAGTILGVLTILMVALSGLRMLLSQGEPDQVKKGKQGLKYALGGFIMAILAYAIVAALENVICPATTGGNFNRSPLLNRCVNDEGFNQFVTGQLIPNLFGLLGLLAILMIIISGFRYVMSAGNDEQAKKGKEGLQWSVIGLVLILLSYVIVQAVESLLKG